MENIDKIIVTNRRVYPRQTQGRVTGFQIHIPGTFSGMLDPDKRYTVTLEVEE